MAVKYRQIHKPAKSAEHAWLLYIYSLPYLFSILSKLINGEVLDLVLVSTAFVAILLAAIWMSTGLKNKALYISKKYSNNTPFPLMFLASLLLGAASFISSWLVADYSLFAGIGFGVASMVGSWLWYGLDPIKSKHLSFNDVNDSEKALEILQDSEKLVINIEEASQNINNIEMRKRLSKITDLARDVLTKLYEKPNTIHKARRFLNTYLNGAESIVERYSASHEDMDDPKLEENFRDVLVNIEQVFTDQYEKLISNDVFDLDVDIEVLNTLLKKQGVN
jgi:5-bromo-4-chloroindolyl phosphate hydrolysis protein